jgi:hypothetical protein
MLLNSNVISDVLFAISLSLFFTSQMQSIGDVGVGDIKGDVAYRKEKEKQAQIVGPLARRTHDRINLKLLKEIDQY